MTMTLFTRKAAGLAAAGVLVVLLGQSGCAPDRTLMLTVKALSARVDNQPTYNDSARFVKTAYMDKHDKDYVMWSMEYASLCLMGGNYDAARDELLRCYDDIQKRQDTDAETAAALSNEAMKVFKGEPFERAMLCTYLGILFYLDGDYNNARIFSRGPTWKTPPPRKTWPRSDTTSGWHTTGWGGRT